VGLLLVTVGWQRICHLGRRTFDQGGHRADQGRGPFLDDSGASCRNSCDRRSSKSYIEQHYPDYVFEKDFAEDDPLWEAELRESDSMQTVRLKGLLDDVFEHDPTTFISFTSHSGAIAAILRATGHRPFALPTGSIIAVLIKAERIPGEPPAVTVDPPVRAPTCAVVPTPSAAP